MTIVWIMLAVLYVVLFAFVGLLALRKGHTVLFVIGFFFPLLWIVGAMLQPTQRAATRQARASLH